MIGSLVVGVVLLIGSCDVEAACWDACDAASPMCDTWIADPDSPSGVVGRVDGEFLCQEDFDAECHRGCEEAVPDHDGDSCLLDCRLDCEESRDYSAWPACKVSCPFVCDKGNG